MASATERARLHKVESLEEDHMTPYADTPTPLQPADIPHEPPVEIPPEGPVGDPSPSELPEIPEGDPPGDGPELAADDAGASALAETAQSPDR